MLTLVMMLLLVMILLLAMMFMLVMVLLSVRSVLVTEKSTFPLWLCTHQAARAAQFTRSQVQSDESEYSRTSPHAVPARRLR